MITRFRQYLIDSYNGLYKIVLEPSMPTKNTVILLVVGMLIGMISAYALFPVVFYNADPSQMSEINRDQWVKMVAASHLAQMYSDADVTALLQQVENPAATVDRLLAAAPAGTIEQAALQSIQPLAANAGAGRPAPQDEGIFKSIISWLLPIIIVVILTPILVLVWRLLIQPNIAAPLLDKLRPKSKEELQKRAELQAEKQVRLAQIELSKNMVKEVDEQLGEPVIQKLSIYTKGRAYDDSFAIEDKNEMFLGECGASKAKTVGDGELAAIEVWLFDKEDFVRTLTKEFVSEFGFNDPATRAELDNKVDNPATDIVPVREGAKIIHETDALRLQAMVKSVTYGTNPALPPNSYFEAINIEIAVWQKAASGAPKPAVVGAPAPVAMPAPVAPMPAPATPSFAPPPAAPTYNPPASPTPMPTMPRPAASPPAPLPRPAAPAPAQPQTGNPGIRPLSPPPLQPLQPRPSAPPPPLPPEDDDPFGGTGDFTPLNG